MRILGFGTYNGARHPRIAILLDGLTSYGHEVRELNCPLAIDTAGRVAALKKPLAALRFISELMRCWSSLLVGGLRYRGAHAPDAVVVGYLGHFDVLLARLLFPSRTIVLDMLVFAEDTAADRHLSGGLKNVLLRFIDHNAMRAADIIVVDTVAEKVLVPEEYLSRVVVVPVGATEPWFAAREERAQALMSASDAANETHVPSAIFYGLFTPLQGAPIIAEALRILDSDGFRMNVTFVGDGQDAGECRDIISNLQGSVQIAWHKWVEPDLLPALVSEHDVCLGIFGTSDKARRVVPNKAYQGMAAGCALVTSDTPVQRAMLGGAHFVEAGNPEALAAELKEIFRSPNVLIQAKALSGERADQAFRAHNVVKLLERSLS